MTTRESPHPVAPTGGHNVEIAASTSEALTGGGHSLSDLHNTEVVLLQAFPPPCFRVVDVCFDGPNGLCRSGVWYIPQQTDGKKSGAGAGVGKWISAPLHLEAVTTDVRSNNYGRVLRFRTTLGQWRTWAMPMEMLRGDCSELRGQLLSMGLEIDPQCWRLLSRYIQDKAPARRVECVLQTGWAGAGFRAFVLPDQVLGPDSSSIIYQSGERGHEEYTTAGTLAGWREGVAAMAAGNPVLMLALCAAFAGPLLARCGAESGGIHLVGDSSTGKTSALEAACSVWGGPNFRRSWRTTSNGMEGVAAIFNDSLLALDEISECDPRQVGAIVYSLANGRGKQRSDSTGAAKPVLRWRSSVLSTGERTITTTMSEGGHRVKAGQSIRVLDVLVQRRFGAWDNVHGHASGTAFSDALKRAAATHHGHVGREFVRHLTLDHDASFSDALESLRASPGLCVPNADGQVKRAAARFACIALAGELATEYGLTGWEVGMAIDAASECFRLWLSLRDRGAGNLERDQVLGGLCEFLGRYGDSRFSDVNGDDHDFGALVRDRAGWWKESIGQRQYLLTASGMREALKGFDFFRALDLLQEAGVLDAPGSDGKRAKAIRVNGKGTQRLYAINQHKLDPGGA